MEHHIHIVGCTARSGTSLMREVLKQCFSISLCKDKEISFYKVPVRDQDQVVLSKAPREVLFMKKALAQNPKLWVVCMMRDPRDVVASKHASAPNMYWTNLRLWHKFYRAIKQCEGHPRFVLVRYEDLVTQPDQVQTALRQHMPFLQQEALFSEYHLVGKERSEGHFEARPISAKRVGIWRHHLPRISGQLQMHGNITPELIEQGYETDAQWLECLKGVEPDLRSSHDKEQTGLTDAWKEWGEALRKSLKYAHKLRSR